MSKKCYRFFGGLLNIQENWLNKMSKRGYRLVRTEKLLYEFENCDSEEYQYVVDFIGEKPQKDVNHYKKFLWDMGYNTFYKNINLNYSIGKVRFRLWTDKGDKIANNSNTFNKELLIVEKLNDGKPFSLYTTSDDKIHYYKKLIKPWISLFVLSLIVGIIKFSNGVIFFGFISIVSTILYSIQIFKIKLNSQIEE